MAINVALAVIQSDQNPTMLLVTQRPSGKPYAGYWEFPGGKQESHETLENCLRREIKEEIGVEIRIHKSLSRHEHQYKHAHVILNAYLCSIISGTPKPLEVAKVKWVEQEKLNELDFPEGNLPLLKEIHQHFRSIARK